MVNSINFIQYLDNENLWKETKTYKRNEFIKHTGTTDTNLYFVIEGSLRVYVESENEEKIIRFGYKHSIISALDSFLIGNASQFGIKTIKKTSVNLLSKSTFDNLLNTNSEFKDLWIDILEELTVQQIEREIDILTASPKERYLRVLRRSPQLFQEIPNKYIASYLRMSPETLSRIKKH